MKKRLLALSCVMMLAAAEARAETAKWVAAWGASPVTPSPAGGPPGRSTPSFNNQTIRQVVRISAGGRKVRIRLTNLYGAAPLKIGAAHIAMAGEGPAIKAGTDKALTFNGKRDATIAPGAPLLSDPVDLPTKALDQLAISLYVPGDTGPCTCHALAMQTGYVSDAGDFTGANFTPKSTTNARPFLASVEIETTAPAKAVIAFGDSITDGVGSTAGANRRWPDLLAERLIKRSPNQAWGMVNQGISGNRITDDGAGQNAQARFDRDVLATPGAAYVVVFEGVNDIGLSYGRGLPPGAAAPRAKVTADDLIAGYRQLIARAHAQGIKIFGATITPYEGASYWAPEGEAVRQAVNTWIRTGKAFDGVIDFDAAVRDPAKPSQMKDGFHAGDHLHGSDAGYKVMANSIDLNLFR
ncbi:MAG: SGNH/GDSL hydrolase family protein [Caulobacteraceae bacterium]